jgi:hypothetical protein
MPQRTSMRTAKKESKNPLATMPASRAPAVESPQTAVDAATQHPSHDAIAALAYRKSLARGDSPGTEQDDWLAAERELSARVERA